jgi:hypothetical protein
MGMLCGFPDDVRPPFVGLIDLLVEGRSESIWGIGEGTKTKTPP